MWVWWRHCAASIAPSPPDESILSLSGQVTGSLAAVQPRYQSPSFLTGTATRIETRQTPRQTLAQHPDTPHTVGAVKKTRHGGPYCYFPVDACVHGTVSWGKRIIKLMIRRTAMGYNGVVRTTFSMPLLCSNSGNEAISACALKVLLKARTCTTK